MLLLANDGISIIVFQFLTCVFMVLVFVLWAVILILTIVWIITTFQKTKHSASVCSTSGILDALSTQDMKWLHGAKLIEFGTLREKGLTHRSPKGFC